MFDNPMSVLSVLKERDGLKRMLMEENGEFSFAELFADSINIQRIDNKKLADSVGINISIERMQPNKAAEILQDAVQGNPVPLVAFFNELEKQRSEVLNELLEQDEHEDFKKKKKQLLFTNKQLNNEDVEDEQED